MSDDNKRMRSGLRPRAAGRRQGLNVGREELVRTTYLPGLGKLPVVVEPTVENLDLVNWVRGNRDFVADQMKTHGGALLRGFTVGGVGAFESFVAELSPDVLDYRYRSTPRTEVQGKVYTSTEYPADQTIPMHNEMSYTATWPRKIWFYSVKVASAGGETPIADSREVHRRLDPEIVDKFVKKNVLYVRNYGNEIDLGWQEVFQTSERREVEAYCRGAGIELEWVGADGLRTREVCQAEAVHPETGEKLWFNQAHLFHVSSLHPDVREFLMEEFREDELPRNTYYGDGSPIEEAYLEEIRRVYSEVQVVFPWREEDVLMLDNMLVAHGRMPFEGTRKVVVAMAEAWSDAGNRRNDGDASTI